jgi:sedoheptulokinase
MRLIGIDAGTTSISGVLLNSETREIEALESKEHLARIATDSPEEDIQDPELILQTVQHILSALSEVAAEKMKAGVPGGPVSAISITGQVHGILYVDKQGRHVSPLYTWQDTRGSRRKEDDSTGKSWSEWAADVVGYAVPPGYGFLTHLINTHEKKVPPETAYFTTIIGYLSMRLSGSPTPCLDATDAHSLGCFQLSTNRFDMDALARLGVSDEILPVVVPSDKALGETPEGVTVFPGVGDNQASCIGAVREFETSCLIGIGTSAQISMYSDNSTDSFLDGATGKFTGWLGPLELRPFPGGGTLISGASIAGGSSYRLLEQLIREICTKYCGTDPGNILEEMNSINYDSLQGDLRLTVDTQFLGTRQNPDARGRISGIGKTNLTHDYLVEGFLRGIVRELKGFFRELPADLRNQYTDIVGVGNGLRRNPLLRRILQDEFGMSLEHPSNKEEAALGAAFIAGVGAGAYESYTAKNRPIVYRNTEKE